MIKCGGMHREVTVSPAGTKPHAADGQSKIM